MTSPTKSEVEREAIPERYHEWDIVQMRGTTSVYLFILRNNIDQMQCGGNICLTVFGFTLKFREQIEEV
jgi:hypothetical protein